VTQYIGTPHYLTREHLGVLDQKGFEFGSHSVTHPHLTLISEKNAFQEIRDSRMELQRLSKTPISSFAYPYGDYNAALVRMVQDVGYDAALTIREGNCSQDSDVHALPRKQVLKTPFIILPVIARASFDGILNWLSRQRFWTGDSA